MVTKDENDAVSPVIGVMLMLVVTIIIAAVVSSFGSGMLSEAETGSTTQIRYVGVMDGDAGDLQEIGLVFENAGGDPVYLQNYELNLKSSTGAEAVIAYADIPSLTYRGVSAAGEVRLSSTYGYRFKKIGITAETAAVANRPDNLRLMTGERFVIHVDRYMPDEGPQGSVYVLSERGGSTYSEGTFKVSSSTSYTLVDKTSGAVVSSGTLTGLIL